MVFSTIIGALVAHWVKRQPADVVVPVSISDGGEKLFECSRGCIAHQMANIIHPHGGGGGGG